MENVAAVGGRGRVGRGGVGMVNWPGVIIGLVGAGLFYWLPRSAWHRRRMDELHGERAPQMLRARVRMYTVVAWLFFLDALINL